MKKPILLLPLLLLFSSSLLAQWHGPNIPDSLSFQGFITDSNGVALNTTADITFRLYKGASQVWTQTKTATEVTDGVFSVILGGSGLQSLGAVAFNEPMDLEIRYGNITLTPRTPLTATAYALGMRGMYAVWDDNGFSKGYNIIGGADINHVPDGTVGATISGGGGWTSLGTNPRPDSVVGDFGTVGGGIHNTAGFAAAVGGGQDNKATGSSSTVGGGQDNKASGQNATVSGGQTNRATEPFSAVGGGTNNQATGWLATVGGGSVNLASGRRSTIPGGSGNQASGGYSFAAGHRAQANHNGAFVWADSMNGSPGIPFPSTGANQFLIRAAGGVGIGTNAPDAQLDVAGSIHSSGAASSTILYKSTNKSGTPLGDGFRLRYDPNYFGNNLDGLVIEKTDGNQGNPDGGIAFVNTGSDGTIETSMTIRGDGDTGFGTASPTSHVTIARASQGQSRQLELETGGTISTGNYDGIQFTQLSGSEAMLGAIDLQFLSTGRTKMTFRIRNGDSLMTIRDGGVDVNGTLTETSDARLKTDVSPIKDAAAIVGQLSGVSYRWKDPSRGSDPELGFLAQDVADVVPEVVSIGDNGNYSVAYGRLVPLLTEALKEQQMVIEALKGSNRNLEDRVAALERAVIN